MPVSSLCSSTCVSEYDAATQSIKLTMQNGRHVLGVTGSKDSCVIHKLENFLFSLRSVRFAMILDRQGSRGDFADSFMVRPAYHLCGLSQLFAADPAPRQPKLNCGLGNPTSWGEGL